MNESPEFSAEAFEDLLNHALRLNRIACLADKFRREGLSIDEFEDLTKLASEALRQSVGGADLHLAKLIEALPKVARRLGLRRVEHPRMLREALSKVHLPPGPIRLMRQILSERLDLPPPLEPPELVDELDIVLDGLLEELRKHTELIANFLRVITPDAVPWLIKLVEKNPGHAKGALGEALCIWWLREVLGRVKPLWMNTRGPIRVCGVEVDAISLWGEKLGLAEVKVAKPGSREYEKAIEQLSNASKVFEKKPDVLRELFNRVPKRLEVSAVAIVTPRDLGEHREAMMNMLQQAFKGREVAVYDAESIINLLDQWLSKAKKRYIELFKTLRGVLEGMS